MLLSYILAFADCRIGILLCISAKVGIFSALFSASDGGRHCRLDNHRLNLQGFETANSMVVYSMHAIIAADTLLFSEKTVLLPSRYHLFIRCRYC